MVDKNYTHLVIVADRSGSMATIANDMNGGLKELLDEQAKLDGKLLVDILTFDGVVERQIIDGKVEDVNHPIISPRGMTALNDGVGIAVSDLGARLSYLAEEERPGKVIVVIVTDGYENASKEYTATQIQEMVKEQKDKYGWEFVFLGANIDSFSVGAGYGFSKSTTMNYMPTSAGVSSALRSTSSYLTSSRLYEPDAELK